MIVWPGVYVVTVPEAVVDVVVVSVVVVGCVVVVCSVVVVLVCANASGAISVQARETIVFFTMYTSVFMLIVYPPNCVARGPNGRSQGIARPCHV
jgi:hypothetical protein